jgi:hypothetical protein
MPSLAPPPAVDGDDTPTFSSASKGMSGNTSPVLPGTITNGSPEPISVTRRFTP